MHITNGGENFTDIQSEIIQYICNYYDLVKVGETALFHTIKEARRHAPSDKHIWFVRDVEYEDIEEMEGKFFWEIEGWTGQFVNRLGYCVTIQPRKPEHDDFIFGY